MIPKFQDKEERLSDGDHRLLLAQLRSVYDTTRLPNSLTIARLVNPSNAAVLLNARLGTDTSRMNASSHVAYRVPGNRTHRFASIVRFWRHLVLMDGKVVTHFFAYVRLLERVEQKLADWNPVVPDIKSKTADSKTDYPLSEVNMPTVRESNNFAVIPICSIVARLVMRAIDTAAADTPMSFRIVELPIEIRW
jgi:hypothetical protein